MDKPKRIVAIVLASLILTSLTCLAAEPRAKPIANPKVPQSQGDIFDKISESASSAATSVFEQVSNSVVIVEAVSSAGGIQGSGVVYQNKSFGTKREDLFSQVVTNAHVIKNADSVSVLQGNKRYQADIDYVDSEFDLALLSVQGVLLPVSPPSSGAQLKVGEKVFAIGSPLGLENSISEGIISGKREQSGVSLLQTTAPVSKGSSGGGLFDTKGRFVGITTFKLMGGENLNFAVDAGRVSEIDDAQDAAMTLLVSGHRSRSRDELDALTEWLLKAPAENAEKLSTKIKRIWNSTEPVNKVEKECVQILERFLSDQVDKTANIQNKPGKVLMVCSVASENGTYRHDETFELDYTNKTVNGYPAQFTDAEIWWTETRGNTEVYLTLNRYLGSIRVGSKQFPTLLFGQCSPAAERKF